MEPQKTAERYERIGLAAVEQGQYVAALRALERCVELEAERPLAWRALGEVLSRQGELERAEQALRRAVALLPTRDSFRRALGRTILQRLQRKARWSGAFRLPSLDLDDRESHRSLTEAIELLKSSVTSAPKESADHAYLAEALVVGGEYGEALDLCRNTMRAGCGSAHGHYIMAASLAGLCRFDEAVAELGAAVRADPDYPPAHRSLGCLLKRLGQNEAAHQALLRYLELRPSTEDGDEDEEEVRAMLEAL